MKQFSIVLILDRDFIKTHLGRLHFEYDMSGMNYYKNQDIIGPFSFLYFPLLVSRKKKS